MAKFKDVLIGPTWWLAIFYGDKFVPLYPSHKAGDCAYPGQRLWANS